MHPPSKVCLISLKMRLRLYEASCTRSLGSDRGEARGLEWQIGMMTQQYPSLIPELGSHISWKKSSSLHMVKAPQIFAFLLLASQHLVPFESEASDKARKIPPLDIPEVGNSFGFSATCASSW